MHAPKYEDNGAGAQEMAFEMALCVPQIHLDNAFAYVMHADSDRPGGKHESQRNVREPHQKTNKTETKQKKTVNIRPEENAREQKSSMT